MEIPLPNNFSELRYELKRQVENCKYNIQHKNIHLYMLKMSFLPPQWLAHGKDQSVIHHLMPVMQRGVQVVIF